MGEDTSVKVWDPALRAFHWSAAASFAVAYATQEEDYDLHLGAGYLLLGLLVFRILWGFTGPHHARFHNFLTGPQPVLHYLAGLRRGNAPRYLGHNPAGAAMMLSMLLALLFVSLSGIALDAAENRAGPLAGFDLFRFLDFIEEAHEIGADACLLLVLVHIAGVLVSSRAHGENLARSMITGRKKRDPG